MLSAIILYIHLGVGFPLLILVNWQREGLKVGISNV